MSEKEHWRDDFAEHALSRGPLHPHSMNGDRCRRRWKLLTFADGSQMFHCVGCDVSISDSATQMFRELMTALKKERQL